MTNQRFLKSMTKSLYICFCAIILIGCQQKDALLFKNVSPKQSNVTFQNDVIETEDLSILDYLYFYNGGGVAIGDINNDGLPDIFFSGNQVKNKLYLNKGNLEFQDISDEAGLDLDTISMLIEEVGLACVEMN